MRFMFCVPIKIDFKVLLYLFYVCIQIVVLVCWGPSSIVLLNFFGYKMVLFIFEIYSNILYQLLEILL